jgi:prophage maintenance system killer protein
VFPFFSGIHILRIGVMCFEEGKKRDAIVALLVFLKMRKQQRQLQQLMQLSATKAKSEEKNVQQCFFHGTKVKKRNTEKR